MSEKLLDRKGRWRNKIIAFRVSPEEDAQINKLVKLTGGTKQDYITSKLWNKNVIVMGNPRVHKALKNEFAEIYDELKRIEKAGELTEEFIECMDIAFRIYEGLSTSDM